MAHWTGWVAGQYVMAAIGASIDNKKNPYPEQPFGIEGTKKEMVEDELAAIEFAAWAERFSKQEGFIE